MNWLIAEESFEVARSIFGNAPAPTVISQLHRRNHEFADAFEFIRNSPLRETLEHHMLSAYVMDLMYADMLQKDLFDYLFPMMLADWVWSLLCNRPCLYWEGEFHTAISYAEIPSRMLSEEQKSRTESFFSDYLLRWVEIHGANEIASRTDGFSCWIRRINSLSSTSFDLRTFFESLRTPIFLPRMAMFLMLDSLTANDLPHSSFLEDDLYPIADHGWYEWNLDSLCSVFSHKTVSSFLLELNSSSDRLLKSYGQELIGNPHFWVRLDRAVTSIANHFRCKR